MNKTLVSLTLAAALAGCATDDLETSTTESDIDVYGWLDDITIPYQASSYQVGISQLGTNLHMMYTDSGSHFIRRSSFSGNFWTSSFNTNLQADYGPALTTFNNQLYTVYHSHDQNRLLMSTSTDGTFWSGPVAAGAPLLGGATVTYAPAAGVMNNTMFIAYCVHDGAGDHVRVDQKLSASWVTKQEYDVPGTCKSVALGPTPDRGLRLIYNEDLAGTWYMNDVRLYGDAGTSYGPDLLTFRSKKPSSVMTCNSRLHMVHGGNSTPEEIWWSYLGLDGKWVADKRVPNQASDGGSQLACFNNRLIMVHNGGYNQLWWSEYIPD